MRHCAVQTTEGWLRPSESALGPSSSSVPHSSATARPCSCFRVLKATDEPEMVSTSARKMVGNAEDSGSEENFGGPAHALRTFSASTPSARMSRSPATTSRSSVSPRNPRSPGHGFPAERTRRSRTDSSSADSLFNKTRSQTRLVKNARHFRQKNPQDRDEDRRVRHREKQLLKSYLSTESGQANGSEPEDSGWRDQGSTAGIRRPPLTPLRSLPELLGRQSEVQLGGLAPRTRRDKHNVAYRLQKEEPTEEGKGKEEAQLGWEGDIEDYTRRRGAIKARRRTEEEQEFESSATSIFVARSASEGSRTSLARANTTDGRERSPGESNRYLADEMATALQATREEACAEDNNEGGREGSGQGSEPGITSLFCRGSPIFSSVGAPPRLYSRKTPCGEGPSRTFPTKPCLSPQHACIHLCSQSSSTPVSSPAAESCPGEELRSPGHHQGQHPSPLLYPYGGTPVRTRCSPAAALLLVPGRNPSPEAQTMAADTVASTAIHSEDATVPIRSMQEGITGLAGPNATFRPLVPGLRHASAAHPNSGTILIAASGFPSQSTFRQTSIQLAGPTTGEVPRVPTGDQCQAVSGRRTVVWTAPYDRRVPSPPSSGICNLSAVYCFKTRMSPSRVRVLHPVPLSGKPESSVQPFLPCRLRGEEEEEPFN